MIATTFSCQMNAEELLAFCAGGQKWLASSIELRPLAGILHDFWSNGLCKLESYLTDLFSKLVGKLLYTSWLLRGWLHKKNDQQTPGGRVGCMLVLSLWVHVDAGFAVEGSVLLNSLMHHHKVWVLDLVSEVWAVDCNSVVNVVPHLRLVVYWVMFVPLLCV